MAPMIDMVFLLLVFFMTVSTLKQDERIPLPLPESEQSRIPDESGARGHISLRFDEGGGPQWYLGARPVSPDELRSLLRAGLARDPALEINVRAPEDMPFGEIRKVLQLCAETGAYRIVYATYQVS